MLRMALLGVAGVLLAAPFRHGKTEYSTYISLGISVLIFLGVLDQLEILADAVRDIGEITGLDGAYVRTMLKMIGITYAAELASGICKDAGYQTIAVQLEIFAKLLIMALSIPVLNTVLQTIGAFLP